MTDDEMLCAPDVGPRWGERTTERAVFTEGAEETREFRQRQANDLQRASALAEFEDPNAVHGDDDRRGVDDCGWWTRLRTNAVFGGAVCDDEGVVFICVQRTRRGEWNERGIDSAEKVVDASQMVLVLHAGVGDIWEVCKVSLVGVHERS